MYSCFMKTCCSIKKNKRGVEIYSFLNLTLFLSKTEKYVINAY